MRIRKRIWVKKSGKMRKELGRKKNTSRHSARAFACQRWHITVKWAISFSTLPPAAPIFFPTSLCCPNCPLALFARPSPSPCVRAASSGHWHSPLIIPTRLSRAAPAMLFARPPIHRTGSPSRDHTLIARRHFSSEAACYSLASSLGVFFIFFGQWLLKIALFVSRVLCCKLSSISHLPREASCSIVDHCLFHGPSGVWTPLAAINLLFFHRLWVDSETLVLSGGGHCFLAYD